MNVLVLGSGGREHAIAWKIKQSDKCENLFCMPGNPGTAQIATNVAGGVKDFEAIKECVLSNNIDIVVVGPEDPLVFGLKDMFAADQELKDVLWSELNSEENRLAAVKRDELVHRDYDRRMLAADFADWEADYEDEDAVGDDEEFGYDEFDFDEE